MLKVGDEVRVIGQRAVVSRIEDERVFIRYLGPGGEPEAAEVRVDPTQVQRVDPPAPQ